MPQPLYTAENCRIAYQLHWSLTLFAVHPWQHRDEWWEPLGQATEADGVRLLEFQPCDAATGQLLISSRPEVSPAQIIRSVKGRLQYLVRDSMPKLWRRHYSIASVGSANNEVLQRYVGGQVEHHPMADSRTADRLAKAQFHDPAIDLAALRSSSHGRFTHSLHLVLENKSRVSDTREQWLEATRTMLIGACRKKGWLLSRLGLVANHLHVLLGCDVAETPREAAISLMNNLAFAHGMRPVYDYGFYVGTFGPYDHGAIRRAL
jgi:REP element-mobilizing transposase RayT